MKTLLAILLLLALLAGGLGSFYWKFGADRTPDWRTAAIERSDLVLAVSATGTVEPEEVVDVGAQVVGRVKEFGRDPHDPTKRIDYGTQVEQGTVLAQIDDATYQAAVEQARASLRRAEAEAERLEVKLRQAERDWKRAQNLEATITPSEREAYLAVYESAKADLKVGTAAIGFAQAALKQAETSLGYATIRSPIQGVVIDRRVNVGQTVVSSLNAPSLFLLAKDLTRMEVWASINEADIGNIYVGQPASFSVDAFPERTFQGKVSQVRLNASMNQNVVTYTVVVTTNNRDGKLLPYMTANLQFEIDRRSKALLVTNQALRWRPKRAQVAPAARGEYVAWLKSRPAKDEGALWLTAGEGLVRPVQVKLGLTDGTKTELLSGDLKPGQEVVMGEQVSGGPVPRSAFMPQFKGRRGSKEDQ